MIMTNEQRSLSGSSMLELLTKLWPLHRTVNSDDMEIALEVCGEYLGDDANYTLHRFKPNTDVLTWWIPERYKVNEAWLEIDGVRIADFAENPLHLLSYSLPKKIECTLGEIREHIWSNPKRPHAIPWEFKYYQRSWGFCVRHADLEQFDDNAMVRGVIDVDFTDEDFCLADYYLPGESDEDILFITDICHPYQVNDSLTGLVVALEMAKQLAQRKKRHYGFRVLVVPETIGSIAWFSKSGEQVESIKYALFCEMVGHDNSFILQRSRQRDSLIDRAFLTVLSKHRTHGEERTGEFREVVGNDEMVSNGPGFDIPTPSLTRWPYDEYHTSDDNPTIVKHENLCEALDVFMEVWEELEKNYYPKRKFQGPIMLSRYGLWVDWREDLELNLKLEKIMMMLEGNQSVIDIAYELSLPAVTVRKYLDLFFDAGLIEKNPAGL